MSYAFLADAAPKRPTSASNRFDVACSRRHTESAPHSVIPRGSLRSDPRVTIPSHSLPAGLPPTERVIRAVVWNQLLWTAGYALTSGGFLLYFAAELGAKGFVTATLLALPELVGLSAVGTRPLVRWFGHRKWLWASAGLLARLASLAISLMAFPSLRPTSHGALTVLIVALAVSQVLQSISYVALLSWLADLVPETRWGRFFATRNLARIAVQMVVPVAAGYARDYWKSHLPASVALWAYVLAFAIGTLLLLLSMIPLIRLPDPTRHQPSSDDPHVLERVADRRSFLLLLIHGWWLAAANGLTQAAFFRYRIGPLNISLGTYYLLENTMLAVMIPVSLISGRISDRRGNKWLLFWGVTIAAAAMPVWLVVTRERWWVLFFAQAFWGAFAAANLGGYNLLLKLSPRRGNTLHLALFQQGSGLLAGLSGLFGGWWLDQLLAASFHAQVGSYNVDAYRLLFLISFAGRITAPLWILPIREPEPPRPSAPRDEEPERVLTRGRPTILPTSPS